MYQWLRSTDIQPDCKCLRSPWTDCTSFYPWAASLQAASKANLIYGDSSKPVAGCWPTHDGNPVHLQKQKKIAAQRRQQRHCCSCCNLLLFRRDGQASKGGYFKYPRRQIQSNKSSFCIKQGTGRKGKDSVRDLKQIAAHCAMRCKPLPPSGRSGCKPTSEQQAQPCHQFGHRRLPTLVKNHTPERSAA